MLSAQPQTGGCLHATFFSPAGKVHSRRQARATAASKLAACMIARRSSARQTKRAPHLDAAEVVVDALAAAERQVGRKVERDRAAEPAQRLADGQALIDGLAERALQVRGQRATVHRPARRGARQRRLACLARTSSAAARDARGARQIARVTVSGLAGLCNAVVMDPASTCKSCPKPM
jgi:hypothetical protein